MVFSVMHPLAPHIEVEVDYHRSIEDRILELTTKTASNLSWLDIGDKVPINSQSGLLPALGIFHPNYARPSR